MRGDINVRGLDKLMATLREAGEDADTLMGDVLHDMAEFTHEAAVNSIQQGPATGTIYTKSNPTRTHQASAPGEAPATDTGRLASSVMVAFPTPTQLRARVGTDLDYGAHLEFGTSRMPKGRPWLSPAVRKAARKVRRDLKRRIGGLFK